LSFLWYDPAIEPRPPEGLPLVEEFANQGQLILRSGWGPDDTVLSFTCAPEGGHAAGAAARAGAESWFGGRNETWPHGGGYSHSHTLANSFSLYCGGNFLVPAPGYGGPGVGKRVSSYQSTLTIDGAEQSRHPARMARLVRRDFQDDYAYWVGEAHEPYQESIELERWRRHVAWLPPGVFVMGDELRAPAPRATGRPTIWHMIYHGEVNYANLDPTGTAVTLMPRNPGPTAGVLRVEFLEPEGLKIDPAALGEPDHDQVLLNQVRATASDIFAHSRRARFLAVLTALKDSAEAPPVVRVVRGEGVMGAVIDGEQGSRAAIFALGEAAGGLRAGLSAPKGNALTARVFSLEPMAGYEVSIRSVPAERADLAGYEIVLAPGGRRRANRAGTLTIHIGAR
jgi:hypothetical protein